MDDAAPSGGARARSHRAEAPRVNEQVAAAWRVLPDYLGAARPAERRRARARARPQPAARGRGRRSARWRWPVLAFASVVQTIPSLALLALFYPLLLALSALSSARARPRILRARIPALAARADALFDAADHPQRRRGHRQPGSGRSSRPRAASA